MWETIISFIPLIASTSGIAIIGKVAIAIIKRIAKKEDAKVKALEEQNAELKQANLILVQERDQLKEYLVKTEAKLDESIITINNKDNAIREELALIKADHDNMEEFVKSVTVLRNQLRLKEKNEQE